MTSLKLTQIGNSVGVILPQVSNNGWRLTAPQADATLTMLAVAAGQMDGAAFARWLRQRSRRR